MFHYGLTRDQWVMTIIARLLVQLDLKSAQKFIIIILLLYTNYSCFIRSNDIFSCLSSHDYSYNVQFIIIIIIIIIALISIFIYLDCVDM